MDKIKRQNRLMIMGALIILGALLLWTIGFEIYARNAEKKGVIDEDIEIVTLSLDNTVTYIDASETSKASYSLTRSGNFEWKMYGKELRITARGGVLELEIPSGLQTLEITNSGSDTSIYTMKTGELRVVTDSALVISNLEAERSKLDVGSLDMTSSDVDRLLINAEGRVDITETDSRNMDLFFKDLDASVLGGEIGTVTAVSGQGCLEIEPENGISSITVTGGASTIFIEGEDIDSQSYQKDDNPEGATIKFTSPKGSVKTC